MSSQPTLQRPPPPSEPSRPLTPKPNHPLAKSHPSSALSLLSATTAVPGLRPRYFHSRRIKPGTASQPWQNRKDPMAKWSTILPILGIVVGIGISGVLVWQGLGTVVRHEYCLILDDDFSGGLDERVWTKEAEVGGFGNGQFEQTTATDENIFISNSQLIIQPTLQDASLIETDNSTIDLRASNACTSDLWSNCLAVTNHTNGTIVPPVKSGRLNTKLGARIKYGRVEVVAKLPQGDWLWPAIWLLPVNSTYGPWPMSGEIDIAESRGNNYTFVQGGNNIVSSAIHWGPDEANDGWWRNNVKRDAMHSTFAAGFHTFGLEWSEKYLFTYVDNRLLQVTFVEFDRPFWEKGEFPLADSNGTRFVDPWSWTGRLATPFDQEFYLILDVAVGGTNGWFKDGKSGKPWVDASPSARLDFWNAREKWFLTWGNEARLVVKSVKMWQQKGYNGC